MSAKPNRFKTRPALTMSINLIALRPKIMAFGGVLKMNFSLQTTYLDSPSRKNKSIGTTQSDGQNEF